MKRPAIALLAILLSASVYADDWTGGGGGGAATSVTSGTTPITSGLDKAVCFDSGGIIHCDDAGLTYDLATDLLATEAVSATGAGHSLFSLTNYGDPGEINLVRTRGTKVSPTAVQNGDSLGSWLFKGYDGSAITTWRAGLQGAAAENWTGIAQGASLSLSVTPRGTIVPIVGAYMDADGMFIRGDTNTATPDLGTSVKKWRNLYLSGIITAGSGPTTVTDATGKVLYAALATTPTPQPTFAYTAPTPQPTPTPLAFSTPGKIAVFSTPGANHQPYAGFTPAAAGNFVTGLDGFGAPTLATPVPQATFAYTAPTPQPTFAYVPPTPVPGATPAPTKYWIPTAACQNATAGLLWDTPTSNPAVAACITGTNTQKGVADFADGANSLSIQTTLKLPSNYNSAGTTSVILKWLTTATSGSVVWQVATICVADAETDDPSFNTASTVTDAAKGTTNQTNDASIATLTMTGCAADELMHVKVFRDPTNGSDDLAATARLIGLELTVPRT